VRVCAAERAPLPLQRQVSAASCVMAAHTALGMFRPRCCVSVRWLLLLLPACGAAGSACSDDVSCQAKLQDLIGKLDSTHEGMKGKHQTLKALQEIRSGVLEGRRIELPSAQREHLEKGAPIVSEISVDARHKPISTNQTRHFIRQRTIAEGSRVAFHTFMVLKKPSGSKAGPAALLVTLDTDSKLSIYSMDGDVLLDRQDLGHGPGRMVTLIALSPSQENHFVASGDDSGTVRVHNLKVVAKREKKVVKGNVTAMANSSDEDSSESEPSEEERLPSKKPAQQQQQLIVTANFSSTFALPTGAAGEVRKLNALLPVDRGSQTYFVTGDSLGGISVFYRNGTIKGRVRVTEDLGGVGGLLRGQGQTVLFHSSHNFGFFSVSQIDVQYPPCSGWNAPLYDVAVDPSQSYSRVILSLTDGDVLVFSTTRGKSKACDLTLKFPHVSNIPFKLHVLKGHVLGLPVPVEEEDIKANALREIHFFNTAAMDAGYGVTPSRAVTLQVAFKPRQPESFALHGSAGTGQGAGKSQIALRFADEPGIELYELNLKTPPPPKSAGGGGGGGGGGGASSMLGGGSGGTDDAWSWLNWFPKIGVFGIALIGVVIWNVRKVTSQKKESRGGGGGMDDFDDDYLQKLREKKRLRESEKKPTGGDGGDDD